MTDIAVEELAARLGEVPIVYVRHAGEYNGTAGCSCDPRQGHIPGAVNISLDELRSLSPEGIRERVGLEPGAEVVAYCHTGARSGAAVQLLQQAGYNARNYVGSWHEWARTDEPVA